MKPLAIYIHVPFCKRKCAYCDFASWPGGEDRWRQYFDTLMTEIRLWSGITDFGRLSGEYEVSSVFFGGGTPSLVNAEYILKVLDGCRDIAPFCDDAEITLEGNPGTLTPEKLEAYRRAGVNRLSLGAQSFDDGLLRALGRIHSAAQIGEAVRMAKDAGFQNINLDLMYALPGQTMAQWLDTLERAIALDVQHISAYSLIVEDGTPMAERVSRGEAVIPEDEAVNAMQRTATARLAKADFSRYEISNYARPKSECRHNLTYWRRGDYLGLGCAAHSLLKECRFSNPALLEDYLDGKRREDFQRLTPEDAVEETLMLTTRMSEGIDLARWREAFGRDLCEACRESLRRLEAAGLLRVSQGRLYLTGKGMEVQDAVVLELLSELEDRG